MYTPNTDTLAEQVAALDAAMDLAPTLTPNFGGMSLDDLPALLLTLIDRGRNTQEAIDRFLRQHNYPYGTDVTHYFLDRFDGREMPRTTLWYVDREGHYRAGGRRKSRLYDDVPD